MIKKPSSQGFCSEDYGHMVPPTYHEAVINIDRDP